MLVDNVTITIRAGSGGNGSVSLYHGGRGGKGGPDGGNGGRGGNINFMGSTNVTDLREFRYNKIITSGNGGNGLHQKMNGRQAEDVVTLIPLGTK